VWRLIALILLILIVLSVDVACGKGIVPCALILIIVLIIVLIITLVIALIIVLGIIVWAVLEVRIIVSGVLILLPFFVVRSVQAVTLLYF